MEEIVKLLTTLRYGKGRFRVTVRWRYAMLCMGGCVTRRLFNSNNATSAALAEVCALLGALAVVPQSVIVLKMSRRFSESKYKILYSCQ